MILTRYRARLPLAASEQRNGVDKAIQVVGVECQINTISRDHVVRAHSVYIVYVHIAARTFEAKYPILAHFTVALVGASYHGCQRY